MGILIKYQNYPKKTKKKIVGAAGPIPEEPTTPGRPWVSHARLPLALSSKGGLTRGGGTDLPI